MGLFAILNVTLVTLSDELLLVLAFFRSAHLSCQNTLLYFSVPNTYLHKQSRYLLFGSAMLGLNTYSWIFPWYFANVLCHLSSRFTLVFIYTSDSNVSSQTFHMTYFPWFSPPFLQTSLEYSEFLQNVHANSGLWFSCKPVSLVFLPKPLTHLCWFWSCHLNLKWALDYWPERMRSFHTSYRLFTAFGENSSGESKQRSYPTGPSFGFVCVICRQVFRYQMALKPILLKL